MSSNLEGENSETEAIDVKLISNCDEKCLGQVRALWYQLYCLERGVLLRMADTARQQLTDPLLGKGNLFIARGTATGFIYGTVLSTYCQYGIPSRYESFYEMARIDVHPATTSITTKLMVARCRRGSNIASRLACATYQQGLRDGITHNFMDCNEPLYPFFTALGFRHHAGPKIDEDFGTVRVMLLRLREDQPYFRAIRSPFMRYIDKRVLA